MRKILFRGKDYKGNWVYGSLVEHKIIISNGMISSYNILYQDENDWGSFNEIKQCSIDKETIGQFTGLTDKNGKKIFEGDIIKARHNEDLYIVKWEDCSFVIEDKWGSRIRRHQDSINRLECEIVGNIWGNPEMIKENEDE